MDQLDEPLQALFASHVDTVYRALDVMYPEIHRAVDLLGESLLADRRVLVCGSPEMTRELRHILSARSFVTNRRGVPGQMAFEKYW